MPRLGVPSLQHLARNWYNDPHRIKNKLVALAKSPPTFGYNLLTSAARDLLAFHQPYDEVVKGIVRAEKREYVCKNFLEVLPLIDGYFKSITPHAVQAVDSQIYEASEGLRVPFRPPFLYELGGQLHLPWFSFWRANPLSGLNLSLFASMVDDILRTTPALRGAKVTILDFSRPDPKTPRQLRTVELADVPRVSDVEKLAMLATFSEGFFAARRELASADLKAEKREDRKPRDDDRSEDLFR